MDLASGYSDSTNYGNGYTPLANNAINNNNADYLRNQLAMQQAGQYNPFAQSGGFGAMTDYYSGLGRDYTTATGGNIFGNSSGGGGAQQPAPNTATMFDGLSAADMATWQRAMYSAGRGNEIPNQNPAVDWTSVFNTYTQPALSRAPQVEPNNPGSSSQAPAAPQTSMYNPSSQALLGYTPQQLYSGGGIGSDAARAPAQSSVFNTGASAVPFAGLSAGDMATWSRTMQAAGRGNEIPSFWQGVRDYTGMGQPGGSGYDPYAGLGNQGQQGVTDPMGYGTGGYQGNAIPNPNTNRAPVQGGTDIGGFWQGIRDMTGADPKDQSRLPQGGNTYPGATNPNYQPGGMTPQQPFQSWVNAS